MKQYKVYRAVLILVLIMIVSSFQIVAQMVWNQAAYFDGKGYIAVPPSSTIDFTKLFTLEAWVKTTSSGVVTVAGTDEFRLLIDNGVERIQSNNSTILMGKTKINNGKWNHVAVTRYGTNSFAIYINGILDTTIVVNIAEVPSAGTDSLIIGKSIYGYEPAILDEVRMWNIPLSDLGFSAFRFLSLSPGPESAYFSNLVLSLTFQSTNHIEHYLDLSDKSGKGNNGFNRGAIDVDMSNAPSSYISLNDALALNEGDYAVVKNNANLPATGPFTLEAWIYPFNSASGQQQSIISRANASNGGYELYLSPTGQLGFTAEDTFFQYAEILPSNEWTHVAVTYTYNGIQALANLFINGKLRVSATVAPITTVFDSLCIGRSAAKTNFYSGYIDEVRLSNYAKTAQDIQQGMFTSIDNMNLRSPSNIELVYSFDGSVYPTTLSGPALSLRFGASFSSLGSGFSTPISPLTRDPSSPGSFPDGYYLKSLQDRLPISGTDGESFEDTLTITHDVTIKNLKVFLSFNHENEGSLQFTLISPHGDSLTFWNNDSQNEPYNGMTTIFDDNADSSMSRNYLSFTPTIRPHSLLNQVFAGKSSAGQWRLRMTQTANGYYGYVYGWGLQFNNETITGIDNSRGNISNTFNLEQNYPNPFNPTTTINYKISRSGYVTLIIYDELGLKVKTLVNQYQSEGNYKIDFNASNLSSGVYFYQLKAGSNKLTKKMLLLK